MQNDKDKNVYQHLKDAFPNTNSYSKAISLDLSSDKFNLLNLEELDKDKNIEYKIYFSSINYLNASKNSLTFIKLKGYNNLETIIATENYISKVELNLSKLKFLDLSNNMLSKIFEMNSINNLEVLILNKNIITKISCEDLSAVKNTLTHLELNNNKISFSSVNEFCTFFDGFRKIMKKLQILDLNSNIFSNNRVFKGYEVIVADYIQSLTKLNEKQIDRTTPISNNEIEKIIAKMIENEKFVDSNFMKDLDQNEFLYNDITLDKLSKEVEIFNSSNNKVNSASIQNLKLMIKSYLESDSFKNKNEENNDSDEGQVEVDKFESFLEYFNLFIDTNTNLTYIFMEYIFKFALIRNGIFCNLAFDFIINKLSHKNMALNEELFKNTILNYLDNTPDDLIISNFISHCLNIAKDESYRSCIQCILPRILKIIIDNKDVKLYSTSIEVKRLKERISEALVFINIYNEEKYINKFLSNTTLIEAIISISKKLTQIDDAILVSDSKLVIINTEILIFLTRMCYYRNSNKSEIIKENVDKIIGSGLKDKFQQIINTKLFLSDNNKSDTKQTEKLEKKEIVYSRINYTAKLIICYGSLLYRSNDIISKLNDSNSTLCRILNLIVKNQTYDPILISASCCFTLSMFNSEDVKQNKDKSFEKIISKIYSLRYLFKFFKNSSEEFLNTCKIAESYGDTALNKGNAESFKNMRSPIICDMIRDIVELITIIQKYSFSKTLPIHSLCINICDDFNDFERDNLIFDALNIHSDEVRLSIIKCIKYINPEQLSTDEIKILVSKLTTIPIETYISLRILTMIYIFLNNAFSEFIQNSVEKITSNKEIFSIAYESLMKNLETYDLDISDEDFTIKNNLSISIVTFLINMSQHKFLKSCFILNSNNNNILNTLSILYRENSIDNKCMLPIEVEKTFTCYHINNYFEVFKSSKLINPYSYCCARLLIHTADILSNKSSPGYTIEDLDYNKISQSFKEQIETREMKRISTESLMFNEITKIKENQSQTNFMTNDELIEEQTDFITNLHELQNFLLGRLKNMNNNFYNECFEDKFDKGLNSFNYELKTEKIDDGDDDYNSSTNNSSSHTIRDNFIHNLRGEEYYHLNVKKQENYYSYIMKDLIKFNRYGENDLIKSKDEETPNNPYVRSLVVAAFLRCIYSVLKYAANDDIFEKIIKTIFKDNFLTDLIQLSDSTKLNQFNISTKLTGILCILANNFKYSIKEDLKLYNYVGGEIKAEKNLLTLISKISYISSKIVHMYDEGILKENINFFMNEFCDLNSIILAKLDKINFANDYSKKYTITRIMNKKIVNSIVNSILDSMQSDCELIKRVSNNENQKDLDYDLKIIYDSLHANSSLSDNKAYLLSFIINIVPDYFEDIIEKMTRVSYFQGINVRKMFLQTVLQMNLKTQLLKLIEKKTDKNISSIVYSECHFINSNEIEKVLVLFLDDQIEFLILESNEDIKKHEILTKEKFKFSKVQIYIRNIESIITFDYNKLILLKTKENLYLKLHFEQNFNCEEFLFNIFTKNNNVQVRNLNLLDSISNISSNNTDPSSISNKIVEKDEYQRLNEEHGNENSNSDKDVENQSQKFFFSSCFEIAYSFDGYFTSFDDENKKLDAKFLKFQGTEMNVYSIYTNNLKQINVKSIFNSINEREISSNYYSSILKYEKTYSLAGIKRIIYKGVDQIVCEISSSEFFIFKLMDDSSYQFLRYALLFAIKSIKSNKIEINDSQIMNI